MLNDLGTEHLIYLFWDVYVMISLSALTGSDIIRRLLYWLTTASKLPPTMNWPTHVPQPLNHCVVYATRCPPEQMRFDSNECTGKRNYWNGNGEKKRRKKSKRSRRLWKQYIRRAMLIITCCRREQIDNTDTQIVKNSNPSDGNMHRVSRLACTCLPIFFVMIFSSSIQ